jgi:hypothetical protein
MAYYLILCLMGMVFFGAIIGWKRVARWDSIAGFYLFCFFLTFFLRPWYIYQSNYFVLFQTLGIRPFRGWWSQEELALQMGLAVVLGLVCFALGYRKFAPAESRSDEVRMPGDLQRRLVWLSLFLAGLGIASILYFAPFPGIRDIHVAQWAPTAQGEGSGFLNTTGYLAEVALFLIPAPVLFYLSTQRIFPTLIISAPFIILRLWWGYGRQGLVHLGLSLLLAAGLASGVTQRRKALAVTCAFLLLAGAALVFGVLGENRSAVQAYVYTKTGPITKFYETTTSHYLYDLVGFEISLHWLKFTPSVFPYLWGSNYLYQFFILPIPRILWPGKHNIFASFTPSGYVNDMSYLWGNAPGCIGDAWMNGGWLGIIIIFSLTGSICALWQKAKDWQAFPITGLLIFICTYPMAITLVRDGLSALAAMLYFLGVPILLTYLIERKSKY